MSSANELRHENAMDLTSWPDLRRYTTSSENAIVTEANVIHYLINPSIQYNVIFT